MLFEVMFFGGLSTEVEAVDAESAKGKAMQSISERSILWVKPILQFSQYAEKVREIQDMTNDAMHTNSLAHVRGILKTLGSLKDDFAIRHHNAEEEGEAKLVSELAKNLRVALLQKIDELDVGTK